MSDIFDFIDSMDANSDGSKFDFSTQMVVGDRGEKDFADCYKQLAPQKSENPAWDFNLNTGATVELKTDDYSMKDTNNFFIETVSDVRTGKIGGPSRAFKDGVTFFVYYFIRNRTFFWFETAKLQPYIQSLMETHKFPVKTIQNKTWTTTGFAIPRSLLEPVLMHQDYFP